MKLKEIMDLLEKNAEEGVAETIESTTTQEDKAGDTQADAKAKLEAKIMALAGKEQEEAAMEEKEQDEAEIEATTEGLKTAEEYGRYMARGFVDELDKLASGGGDFVDEDDEVEKLASELASTYSEDELLDLLEKTAGIKDFWRYNILRRPRPAPPAPPARTLKGVLLGATKKGRVGRGLGVGAMLAALIASKAHKKRRSK